MFGISCDALSQIFALHLSNFHLYMHTPPNLALRLDGDTSSLTICRTCMLTGRQPDVPQGRGSPFSPSHPQQPHPSLVPPQDSSPNPHHDSRLLVILILASPIVSAGARFWVVLCEFSLNLLPYLFDVPSPDFNTCFTNSPALKCPQILYSVFPYKTSCFTCFECCPCST